jgi:RNA 2',3'-cyclic 3'-phosphodiesterase
MTARIRCFIATDFDAVPFRDVLSKLAGMGRAVRTASEPFHLTLKFLGDTDAGLLEQISQTADEVAANHCHIEVQLTGLGAFPRPERPSVVWAGLAPIQPLQMLAAELESKLEQRGFEPERRPFEPHITLARVKARPPGELRELLDQYREHRFGRATVREITLYESQLTPAGPRYSPLSTHTLSNAVDG